MYEAVFSFSANETALRRFSLFRFYWLRPLGIVLRGRFLFVTTYKTKTGFLLIETFRKTKLWPPGSIPSGHFLMSQCATVIYVDRELSLNLEH